MSGVEVFAGVAVVGVFLVLAWGESLRRTYKRHRRRRSRPSTRPTISHIVTIPSTREW